MKIALGTVIYEAAWKYRYEFLESVKNQTEKGYELLVINDGIPEKEAIDGLESIFKGKMKVETVKERKSISEIRKILLLKAKEEKIDLLILSDFDDIFHEERIEKIVDAVDNKTCIYYNNLKTFNRDMVFKYLPQEVTCFEDILEYNFLGLSNTALDMNLISVEFIQSLEDVITNVFDWYLFSRLLLEGKKGKAVREGYTYYRIQDNNIAGLNNASWESIKKEVLVKCCQYDLLQKENLKYKSLYLKYKELSQDETKLRQKKIQANTGFWWSNLKIGK